MAIADVVKGAPVVPWIPAGLFPTVAVTFILLGLFFAVLFLNYENTVSKGQRSVVKELSYAIPASALLAVGSLYVFLSVGLYV